jgi:CBS domain-containing protein
MSVAAMLEGKPLNIVSASPDDTVKSAVALLAKHRIGAIIICDKSGDITGILSERDIVRDIAREGAGMLNGPISNYMTKKVLSCTSEDSINHVMEIMTANRFRHMPVSDNGKLVGIISIGDVVKRKIEQAEQEAAALKEYIAT